MLNRTFIGKVSQYIDDNALLQHSGKYVVALSGGADSVCLALALKQLGYTVEAAHCNFNLRGAESLRDEDFCKRFCETNHIPLHVARFDTTEFARLRKISIEMAARKLRYSWFDALLGDIGAEAVCVAHHQDDSVETVLLNLIRGTGIHGLAGIKAANGNIRRPLLCVTRKNIETALQEAGQPYVTDSTNLEDDVVRNKIRLDILPVMRQINPSVSDSISKTAARVNAVAGAFDTLIHQAKERIITFHGRDTATIRTDLLMCEAAPEYTLFSILREYSFTPTQTEQIFRAVNAAPGRTFTSSTHQLLIDRANIIIEPLSCDAPRSMVMPESGTYVLSDDMKFKVEIMTCPDKFIPSRQACCCSLDASKVNMPLTVRPATAGDRFIPFGMNGSKLVSDYLTDRKLNLFEKRRQLIVADSKGNILWLVNQRPDNRFRIDDSTTKVLKITCCRD